MVTGINVLVLGVPKLDKWGLILLYLLFHLTVYLSQLVFPQSRAWGKGWDAGYLFRKWLQVRVQNWEGKGKTRHVIELLIVLGNQSSVSLENLWGFFKGWEAGTFIYQLPSFMGWAGPKHLPPLLWKNGEKQLGTCMWVSWHRSLHVASVEREWARSIWHRAQEPAAASSEHECSPSSPLCPPPTQVTHLSILLPWQTDRTQRNDSSRLSSWHRNITGKHSVFLNKTVFLLWTQTKI